ncbi:hypothetical protein [Actinospongicola halichondriae]|uniref:hypothetical protein n=1 Tax=Actinospongicola halichondriae TaxID=3236844 RepID=UPI003D4C492F
MLNTPGEDDHDSDLELRFGEAIDGGDGDDVDDDCMPLDDTKEQVGYELFDWDPTELDELDDALHEMQVPHEWVSDGYEVVVHEENEGQIDALIPTIRFPDELPAEADDGDDTDIEVLSALFVAADRLQKDATGEPVHALLDAAERIGDKPPYGIDEAEWTKVVEQVDEMIDGLHAAIPPALIREMALRLRDRLRPMV